ncbi:hypothetical protein QVD17_04539 [Tagetes erecta]|uniref:Uncharacterized protein n=1 Tax=Tagetes erecta TaxID=13708 RepID=A0AAD8LDC8_TARER|nr:hypothetical protein QVD17_04539 [Tagetes erecta]
MTIDDIPNMYKEEIYPALYTYAPLHDKYSKQSGNKNIRAFMAANRHTSYIENWPEMYSKNGAIENAKTQKDWEKSQEEHTQLQNEVGDSSSVDKVVCLKGVVGETIQGNATNNRTTPDSQQV